MRTSTPAGSAHGLLRFFRPWIIATVLGAALGATLLGLQEGEGREPFYNEPIPRSAALGFTTESPVEPDSGVETMFEARKADPVVVPESPLALEPSAPEPR
jgi:hypothetical protein